MRPITMLALSLLAQLAIFRPAFAECKEGECGPCKTSDGRAGERCCEGGRLSVCRPVDSEPSATSTVRPRYLILTIVYAPPGTTGAEASSMVDYGQESATGTTVSSSSSFKEEYKATATVNGILSGDTSLSFGYSRNSSDSSSLYIKKSASTDIKVFGPPSDGIDHNYDRIYLLLNPLVTLTVEGKQASWSLGHTGPSADIQYVRVDWLKDPSKMLPGLAKRLKDFGFTPSDYAEILKRDQFANGETTIDSNRFLPTSTTFPYEDPGAVMIHGLTSTETSAGSHFAQDEYTVGASYSYGVNFGIIKGSIKAESSWTWTDSSTTSKSSTTSQSASVTVGGPSSGYAGPKDIMVYWDTVYRSFLFAPAPPGVFFCVIP